MSDFARVLRRMKSRVMAIAIVASMFVFLVPVAAYAVTTCALVAGTLTIAVDDTGGFDDVRVTVGVSNAISVFANSAIAADGTGGTAVVCGGSPTLSNTDTITFGETGTGLDAANLISIDLSGTAANFNGGLTAEGDGTNEVEIVVPDLEAGVNSVVIIGSTGNDTILGGSPTATTGAFNLNNRSTETDISLAAPTGGTTIYRVDGGNGDDVVNFGSTAGVFVAAVAVANTLNGGAGNDVMTGGSVVDTFNLDPAASAGNDTYNGGAGADVFNAGDDTGADTYNGGAGLDTVTFAAPAIRTTATTVTIDGTANDGDSGEADNLQVDIENVTTGNVVAGQTNTVTGSILTNVFTGGTGAEVFDGGAGADTFDGGTGVDTVTYASRAAALIITPGDDTANDGEGGAAEGDNIDPAADGCSIENIIAGSGIDTVNYSTGGDDCAGTVNTITGGAGADALTANVADVAAASDLASYATAAAAVTVNQTTGVSTGSDAAGDTFVDVNGVVGSAFNDTLTGGALANSLNGGIGDDTLAGLGAGDVLIGGAGTDTLNYAASGAGVTISLTAGGVQGGGGDGTGDILEAAPTTSENITGSAAADVLTGNALPNVIDGGAGDDSVDGAAGNDTLSGGVGTDIAAFTASAAGVVASLVSGTATGDGSDTLATFESLTGSGLADTLTGDATANTLLGAAGIDTLIPGAGNDTVTGGGDGDTISFAGAAAAITGTLGAAAPQFTGDGNDTVITVAHIIGSSNNDTFTGDAGTVNIIDGGAAGNDTLTANAGDADVVSFFSSTSGVTASLATGTSAGSGTDTFTNFVNLTGSTQVDTLTGSTVANTILGGGSNDSINGGAGIDLLNGEAGNDTYNQGTAPDGADTMGTGAGACAGQPGVADAGTDFVDYGGRSAVVAVDQDNVADDGDTVAPGELDNVCASVEGVGGGAGDDVLSGSGALSGGAGNDVLTATAANTTLTGGPGDDTLDAAGFANVAANFADIPNGVVADLQGGTATGASTDTFLGGVANLIGTPFNDVLRGSGAANTLTGGAGNDNIQGRSGFDVIAGGAGNDRVSGGLGDDVLSGGDGTDTLSGDAGNDTLDGGAGNDTLTGGADDDELVGGTGSDTANYASAVTTTTTGVVVNLSTGEAGGAAGSDTLETVENVIGTDANDTLTGNSSNNRLVGGAGKDRLAGSSGNDRLEGGDGNDTLSAGTGNDTAIGGNGADLLVGSSGADRLFGNGGNDTLSGGAGNDLLSAGAGNDTLTGGLGKDSLFGSSGNDRLFAKDGVTGETVNGGSGTDRCSFDRGDIVRSCP